MNIIRLYETPQGIAGVWAELDDGELYHVVPGDPAPMAVLAQEKIAELDLTPKPFVQPDIIEADPIAEVNDRLQQAGSDIIVIDADDVTGAHLYAKKLEEQAKLDAFETKYSTQGETANG